MKGLREFMVCRNCIFAHIDTDDVECGYEFPGVLLPFDWRCSRGLWVVDVNGNRNVVPLTAIAIDENIPAFKITTPEVAQQPPQPQPLPDELKNKIMQFVKKSDNDPK
jgi:hypothetical protein